MSETLERTWQNNPFLHSIGQCYVDIWMFWKAGLLSLSWKSDLQELFCNVAILKMLVSWCRQKIRNNLPIPSWWRRLLESSNIHASFWQHSPPKTYIKYSSQIHPTKRSKIHSNLFRFASSRIGCSRSTPRSSGTSPYDRYCIVVEYHERQVWRNTIAPSVWRLGARTRQEANRVVEEGTVGWWWQQHNDEPTA